MRIAYLLPDWPAHVRRGYQRIAEERLRRLVARHRVDVFCFARSDDERGLAAPAGLTIHRVLLPKWKSYLGALRAVLEGKPAQVGFYRSDDMRLAVTRQNALHAYDATIVQLVRMADHLPSELHGRRCILDMVDPLSLSYRRSLVWRPWYLRWFFAHEAGRLAAYEAEVAPQFWRVLLISAEDAAAYQSVVPRAHLDVLPYAVDTGRFLPGGDTRTPGMIVLSGNLGYAPNIEAVNHFCQNIFPAIVKARPGACLWLVGTNPDARVRRWAVHPAIRVTGEVPDLGDYLRRAMVSVCPVLHPVGIQTKILEAMATGTPVVATRTAVAGLGVEPGLPVKVADTDAEFVRHVVDLLDGIDWPGYSHRSRDYVARHHSWDAHVALLEGLLAQSPAGPVA